MHEKSNNIASLLNCGIDFTIPSNAREMPVKKLMTKAKKVMGDPDSIRRHEGRTYRVAEYEVGDADLVFGHR